MAKNSNYEKMVLDDSLFLEYHKYKNNEEYDKNTILKLFQYFNGNILTNLAQYKRMGLSPVDNIKSQMVHAANKNQELTSLAKETSIKYILSKDKSIFPYVNVDSDQEKIKNCVGGFFEIQENRDKAVEHIKALCSTAQKIAIYDKYFSNGNDNVALLASILPHHALEIVCYGNEQNGMNEQQINDLYKMCNLYTIKKETREQKLHDRFIDIDDKIEIILTSGFDHLANTKGDFAYVVRAINKNRF